MKCEYVHQFVNIIKSVHLPFQSCKHYVSSLYTYELLNVEHSNPILHTMSNEIMLLLYRYREYHICNKPSRLL